MPYCPLSSSVFSLVLFFLGVSSATYVRVNGWPNLAFTGIRSLGQVSGIGVDSKGDIIVFSRADRVWDIQSFNSHNRINYVSPISGPTVLRFNATTGLLKSMWGENLFFMPHGLTIDKDDNIWLTDVGLHQVMKFSPTGQKLLELGIPLEPGSDASHFCKPADVAVASDGTFFVADGYCNSRVLKFTPEGRIVKEWGRRSTGSFYIPHSLKLDERTQKIYVADREYGRVQILNAEDGAATDFWNPSVFRRLFALDFEIPTTGQQDYLYAVNGQSLVFNNPVRVFVLDMNNDGHIVEEFGDLRQPHDIAVTQNGKFVFVAEITLNTVIKYARV